MHYTDEVPMYGEATNYEDLFDIDTAILIAQSISPLQKLFILNTWVNIPPKTKSAYNTFIEIDAMMDYIHKKCNCAILIVGDHTMDQEHEYNGWMVFQSICTTLDRTVKKIVFDSAVGNLQLFVA